MRVVKDRKEFFSLLDSVSASNRSYFSKYGEWTNPQIKVFWLEVNKRFVNHIIENSGMRNIDKNMFMLEVEDEVFWIDTTDERIWELYTFAKTKTAERVIGKYFTIFKGVDQLWFTEKFMESIQKHFNYHDRGFGIRYKDLLSLEKEMADFSAKFWLGKNVSPKQKDFLDQARDIFSLSSIRFGKSDSEDGEKLSGELYELYFNGHMTVTTTDNIENVFDIMTAVKNSYGNEIRRLESEAKKKPTFVEITYSDSIQKSGFENLTQVGSVQNLKLWLQPYQEEEDITRYSGVDMHTGDFVSIDIADKYAYISVGKGGCMNVAPRFGTLSARYLSTMTNLYYDGVEIFA